jgi:hypothetical protein
MKTEAKRNRPRCRRAEFYSAVWPSCTRQGVENSTGLEQSAPGRGPTARRSTEFHSKPLARLLNALFLSLLLFASSAPAQLLDAMSGPFTVKVVTPAPGRTYTNRFSFGAAIDGGENVPYTILIKAFGVTHHIFFESRLQMLGVYHVFSATDDDLPVTPGNHQMQVSVWPKDKASPIFETNISFAVVKPGSLEKEMDRIREKLEWSSESLAGAEARFAEVSRQVKKGQAAPAKMAEAGDALHRGRVEEFFARIAAFCDLAALYENGLEPEKALRSLQFARDIFDKERATVGAHPQRGAIGTDRPKTPTPAPAHLAALARYYTRRNDIENALRFWQQEAAWYQAQLQRTDLELAARKDSASGLSRAYSEMATVHVLLKNNLDERRACLEKARQVAP